MAARSPTAGQLSGLSVTLTAVALFCGFALWQVRGLRELQNAVQERSRRHSLQLVRIQNDLTHIGLALIDLRELSNPPSLPAYRGQLRRLRGDLDNALELEARLEPARDARAGLKEAAAQLWKEIETALEEAGGGRMREARERMSNRVDASLASFDGQVSRRLQQNIQEETAAAEKTGAIYLRAERNIYIFLGAVLSAMALTGFLVLRSNRRLFREHEALSERRRELAAKVMTVQEETFRQLAREIHDEFGQGLTAMGMMLARVEKKLPAGEEGMRSDLKEVREIAQQTLERARTMSQMLHPPVLDDYGLERSVEWYLGQFRRQTGIEVHYEKQGTSPFVEGETAIHVYRVIQEALSNVARHAGVREAWVQARYASDRIQVGIEDHGGGMPAQAPPGSIGLAAMRERAGLMRGSIEFSRPEVGGTRVELSVPLGGKSR